MKKNLHEIDKIFKAALDDHREEPDASVWNAIDKSLDKKSVVNINRKYTQLKGIAIALLILLIGAGVFTLSTLKKRNDETKLYHKPNTDLNNNPVNLRKAQHKKDTVIAGGIEQINKGVATQKKYIRIPTLPALKYNPITSVDLSKNSFKSPGSVSTSNANLFLLDGRKIISSKKAQNTVITNAEFGEIENETPDEITNKKEGVAGLNNLIKTPAIFPETEGHQQYPDAFNKPQIGTADNLPTGITMQVPAIKNIKMKKALPFSVTAFFAPNVTFNHITDDKMERRPGRPFNPRDREKIREGEQHQFSYSMGLLLDYNLNKHWSLQSGLAIFNKTIRISPKTIYADVDNNGDVKYLYNCSSGYLFLSSKSVTNPAVGDSIQAFESTNTLQYFSIPLVVKYNFSIKKLDLFTSFGPSLNMLTKGKIETTIADGPGKQANTSSTINGLKSSYFGANLGIGASYNISDKIAISFFPAYNFALTSGTKDASVKSYPNTISIAVGLRFKL